MKDKFITKIAYVHYKTLHKPQKLHTGMPVTNSRSAQIPLHIPKLVEIAPKDTPNFKKKSLEAKYRGSFSQVQQMKLVN